MSKFRFIELGLIGLLVLLIILQILEIKVSNLLFLTLMIMDLFWLISLRLAKRFPLRGFDKKSIIEKILISILLWGIILNITTIPKSTLLIGLGLLILSLYYVINSIKNWILKKLDWLSALERLFCGILLFGFLLRFRHFPYASITLVLSLTSLYLLMLSYSIVLLVKMVKNNQVFLGVIFLIYYWGLCAIINYLMFHLMHWSDYEYTFIPGLAITLITGIVIIVKWIKDYKNKHDSKTSVIFDSLRRLIIYCSVGLFFYLLTPHQYYRFEFGNRPRLINAYIKCYFDSKNEETEINCNQFQELDQKRRSGFYQEVNEK